jgi:multiple sugar transport system substrate-binding protein
MSQIGRRGFTLGTAAALTGLPGASRAQDMPRRYAGTTLNLLFRGSPAFDATVRLNRDFTEATGIELNVTRVAPSDHYAKMMLDMTSGTNAFDVALVLYQWKYEFAPFFAELSTINTDVPGAPPLALDDYPAKILEVYGKVGDRLMALPVLGDIAFLLSNRDAFAAKGIDPAPAATWEEVVKRGQALTGGGKFGYALPAGKTPQCYVTWTLLYHAFGGTYFAADGQPTLNSPAGIKAMRFMAEQLMPTSPQGNLTWDYNEVLTSFSTGQSAQAVMWAGGLGALSDPAKAAVAGHFAIASPPGGALLGGTGIGVNAKARQPEAARLYVAWLTSQAVTRRNAAQGTTSPRISTLSDPELVARYPFYPAVKAAMIGETFGYIPMKESEQVLVMIADEANAACAKIKTPEQAADDLQAKALQFMRRRGMLH